MYTLSFQYKGKDYSFSNVVLIKLLGEVIDWLFDNGYEFSGDLHSAFTRKPITIDEIRSSDKSEIYMKRLRHYHKMKDGRLIYIGGNVEPAFSFIKKMLIKFGVQEQTIKHSESKSSKIKPFSEFDDDFDDDLETEFNEDIIEDETPALLKLRAEFWSMFLIEINKVTDKYKNRTRGRDQWFNVTSSTRGINYGCVITSKYVKVEIDIFREKEENNRIFDLLYSKKEQIENEFGDTLSWEKKDDKRVSIICYKKSPINAYDKSNWPEIMDFFLEYFPKFEKTFDPYLEKIDDVKGFTDLYPKKEETKVSYEVNPFMQAVCILGKSGRGKSTTIDNMIEKYPNMIGDFIIPTSSTTGLLAQFSPVKGGYIPSRLGKMIMDAHNDPKTLYTAVFDECHKASIIEMINDELLQCISTKRNKGNRFISLDTETQNLFSGLSDYRGNLLLPDNFGFIFLSSKPDVITSNDDFFRRVNIYVLKKVDYESIDYSEMIIETGVDENGKATYQLNKDYFIFVEGKSKEDIEQIEKLNDEE